MRTRNPVKDINPISELTSDEILNEFRYAIKNKNKTTIDFILLWIDLDIGDYGNIRTEFPEYFL